ncbi:MAG: hypothetical protein H6713_26485 [Myxococcales bacterium]|nr:hypothetical protein [Myxococcales bacterium]MCB9753506.1 hypothetical protein [Myxococcales bacterium]
MTCVLIHLVWSALVCAGEPPSPPPPPASQARVAPRPPLDVDAWLRDQLVRGPSVADVQRAAVNRLAVDPTLARRWRRRARAAAALPVLRGEYDLRTDQGWKLDQEAGLADELSQDSGAGHGVSVRATWELDRLIFDDNELRAARAALDVERERERVVVMVTQLYFERLQLLLELQVSRDVQGPQERPRGPTEGGHPARETLQKHLRVAEIEAVLSAMTGLSFTRPAAARSAGRTSRPNDERAPSSQRAPPRTREFEAINDAS